MHTRVSIARDEGFLLAVRPRTDQAAARLPWRSLPLASHLTPAGSCHVIQKLI